MRTVRSRSVWARGLKQSNGEAQQQALQASRSVWARGLKPHNGGFTWNSLRSRSVWARGLKLPCLAAYCACELSRSVWARGLKPKLVFCLRNHKRVALRVGAWIETLLRRQCRL